MTEIIFLKESMSVNMTIIHRKLVKLFRSYTLQKQL